MHGYVRRKTSESDHFHHPPRSPPGHGRARRRRRPRPGGDRHRRRPDAERRDLLAGDGPSQRQGPLPRPRRRPHRASLRPPGLGGPALGAGGRIASGRPARDVLGHLAPHRRRSRRGPARQPRPLPDPRRPLRRLQRRLLRDLSAEGAPRPGCRPHHGRLVRARRRAPDRRLRRLRPRRLPARRPVAPAVRPGRDPLGADPPDADRGRRHDPDRPGRSAGRGDAGARLPEVRHRAPAPSPP